MSEPRRRPTREDHERGLPDRHHPAAGLLGAPPARSAPADLLVAGRRTGRGEPG
ncbi:hypothetical protein [Geodermatophilus tzadiensis]|uniref:hypothetical protein n=1 Tax=Geodermatophilus tzadiensis TaxID=1137988 RepID=UPI00147651B6|nr:hypothetical protein [Geodermatophilus tzadiensis]